MIKKIEMIQRFTIYEHNGFQINHMIHMSKLVLQGIQREKYGGPNKPQIEMAIQNTARSWEWYIRK